jgi:hypothetical protein
MPGVLGAWRTGLGGDAAAPGGAGTASPVLAVGIVAVWLPPRSRRHARAAPAGHQADRGGASDLPKAVPAEPRPDSEGRARHSGCGKHRAQRLLAGRVAP